MLAAVNFHYIRDSFKSKFPAIYGQTPTQFEQQLKVLASIGEFISADDIKDFIQKNKALPSKSIIITFDDGLKEQYDKALPVLDKLGIPAIFFANTKPITERKILTVHKIHILRSIISPEDFKFLIQTAITKAGIQLNQKEITEKAKLTYRYDTQDQKEVKYLLNFALDFKLKEAIIDRIFSEHFGTDEAEMSKELYFTENQVKELGKRGYLGCHSHNHYPIGMLDEIEKNYEVKYSKEILEKICHLEIFAFSYPYGSFEACEGSTDVLLNNNFVFSFTMERAVNTAINNPYYISRFDTNDVPGGKLFKGDKNSFFKANQIRWQLN